MPTDYVTRQVRRCSRNLAIVGIFFLALTFPLIYLGIDLLSTSSPRPIETRELLLASRTENYPSRRVLFTTDGEPLDTGIRQGNGTRMTHKFVLLPVEDRYLTALVPIDHAGRTFEGRLEAFQGVGDADLVRQITQGDPQAQTCLLPCRLWEPRVTSAGHDRQSDGVGLLGTGLSCTPFGFVPLAIALSRILNPNRSPIARRFKALGDADTLRASLNAEMTQGLERRLGKLRYTPSWLVNEMLFDTDIARVDDIVWLYRLETHGARVSVTAVFRLRTKAGLSVIAGRAQVEEMLALVHARVPWAFNGWSAELDAMWRMDRDGLIRLVEQRYQQYLSPFGLKSAEKPSQSSPDEGIRKSEDGVKPSESPSPKDLTNE